ncbi:hypothetical protein M9435_001103 [Picochlorum sp. BPE23]|nr:hypothetical protein M9435_001103 [Picochlorum sp. BPE23]
MHRISCIVHDHSLLFCSTSSGGGQAYSSSATGLWSGSSGSLVPQQKHSTGIRKCCSGKPLTSHHSRGVLSVSKGQTGSRLYAADKDSSSYAQRETDLNMKLDSLKAETKSSFAETVERVKAMAQKEQGGSEGDDVSGTAPLQARLSVAIEELTSGLIERDTEVRLLLLAALSQEHVLYLGPPGTAKSELGRRLSKLCGGSYFERLLTRFSVPEELFGPLSMRALENDEYVRQVDGYLPTADVAFVDEIFKANSAILNTLLTILNERLFDNGSRRTRVPLLCLVGASNELPESEELDALYDRFLIRRQVGQVSPAGLMDMLTTRKGKWQTNSLRHPGVSMSDSGDWEDGDAPLLTVEDFETTRQRAEEEVHVPAEVLNIVADLRQYLQDKCEPPVYVSDRRLVKSVALLQVAAFSSGRTYVTPKDCMLLQHVLWQKPEESEKIYEWLLQALTQDDGMQQMQYLLSGMFGRACKSLNKPDQVAGVVDEVKQLRQTLEDKLMDIYKKQFGRESGNENVWISPEEVDALDTALSPKMDKTRDEVERLLYEVVTLEVALSQSTEPVVLAELMPRHWSDFVRNAPLEQVQPLGLK